MVDAARQTLMLQDETKLLRFDAEKVTDASAYKSQTLVAWRLLPSCNIPDGVSPAEKQVILLNRYVALQQQLTRRLLAWLTSEYNIQHNSDDKWKSFWDVFQ